MAMFSIDFDVLCGSSIPGNDGGADFPCALQVPARTLNEQRRSEGIGSEHHPVGPAAASCAQTAQVLR